MARHHGSAYSLHCASVRASRSSRMGSRMGSTSSRKIFSVSSDTMSAGPTVVHTHTRHQARETGPSFALSVYADELKSRQLL
jgi:hypothetical protein